ncbi:LOW QUALITY PROTEIN: phosphatidylcholine transfer protein [Phycodurus eques]|uniref:LOW QUALITY PROTEIN: phosphatidylcholine transfer protein n=1 Tax=Phycodurus eques TaxID=693459 RepID=UPI002ACF03A9|nr:LOW QUALITY PROTEIN: phosphatidylcholine transfer protein [Phycodurus eques]
MASLRFSDEEFEAAWKELDEPRLGGGWQLLTETTGVKIYRLLDGETGLYEYKASGSLDSCKAELSPLRFNNNNNQEINTFPFPYPEKNGVLRVQDYKQTVAVEADGRNGTKVFVNYFDHPGGMIPTWLVNWAAESGVPGFLADTRQACAGYPRYCGKK